MQVWLALCFAFAVTICSSAKPRQNQTAVYQALSQEYERFKLEINPEAASYDGYHEFDSELTDWSPEKMEENRERCLGFIRRSRSILDAPDNSISQTDLYLAGLIEDECRTYVRGIDLGGNLFAPVNFLHGVQTQLDNLFGQERFFRYHFETEEDYKIALERLAKVPKALGKIIEALRSGMRRRMMYAVESLSRVDHQFQKMLDKLKEPIQTGFFTPFKDISGNITDAKAGQIKAQAIFIISNEIRPAMEDLSAFMKEEYLNHVRSGPGISNIPNGNEYYQAALDYHTTIKGMLAEEIHAIGLEEVAKLKQNYAKYALKFGQNETSFDNFLDLNRADPVPPFGSIQYHFNYEFPEYEFSGGVGHFASLPAGMIQNYQAFSDGVGLFYRQSTVEEGLQVDQEEILQNYLFDLLRSCRVVVDTGIHAMGWNKERAVAYLLKNTALRPSIADWEVDRYITWPGQAVSAKIGQWAIRKLRAEKEKELGDKFDLGRFLYNLAFCQGPIDKMRECLQLVKNRKDAQNQ